MAVYVILATHTAHGTTYTGAWQPDDVGATSFISSVRIVEPSDRGRFETEGPQRKVEHRGSYVVTAAGPRRVVMGGTTVMAFTSEERTSPDLVAAA